MRHIATALLLAAALSAGADVGPAPPDSRQLAGLESRQLVEWGRAYVMQEQWDSAFMCYSAVVSRDIAGASRDEVAAVTRAYSNLGYVYLYANHDSKKALQHFLNALTLAEKYGFSQFLGYIYLNISYIHYYDRLPSTGGESEMLPYLRKAFDIGMSEGDTKLSIHSLASLIEASLDTGDTTAVAEPLCQFRAVEIPDSVYLRDFIRLMCGAMEAYMEGDYGQSARLFAEASRNVDTDLGAYQYEIDALSCVSGVCVSSGDIQTARRSLDTALSIAVDNGSMPFEASIHGKLARVCALAGDSLSSHEHRFQYLSIKDTLANSAKIGRALEAEFEFNIARANEQINDLEASQRRQKVLLAAATAVVAVVLALLYFLSRAMRSVKQSNRHLYQRNIELLKRLEAGGSQKKYQQSQLSADDSLQIYLRVLELMETSREIYKTDFNVDRLSEMLDLRKKHVSQAINEHAGTNFNGLLNRYRVMEACRMFNDVDRYSDITIEAIATEVGFKSRTGFSAIFKGVTGLTPSVYQRLARDTRQASL